MRCQKSKSYILGENSTQSKSRQQKMLKLSASSSSASSINSLTKLYRSLLSRNSLESQDTAAFSTSSSPRYKRKPRPAKSTSKSLFSILRDVNDPKVSIVPVLERWAKERPVDCVKLQSLVGVMKRLNRWNHALQVPFISCCFD